MSEVRVTARDSSPVPRGVELLLDDGQIEARMTYLRRNMRAPYKPSAELRRLVAEQARRGVDRAIATG